MFGFAHCRLRRLPAFEKFYEHHRAFALEKNFSIVPPRKARAVHRSVNATLRGLPEIVSADAERFREIARGVNHEDLLVEELRFARAKDKGDKSLEIYKFHINALYVAITRAVKNIYLIGMMVI